MAKIGTRIGLRTCSTLMLFLCLPYISITNEIYRPIDMYTINCGSSENLTNGGRIWAADTANKIQDLNNNSVGAEALIQATIQGPYTSARLSYSQFTYSFPLNSAGQKFVRLFFRTALYKNFVDPTKAYFSVKSGNYTLLEDFNASLYADPDDASQGIIFKEYTVYVQDDTLNVTFIPSTSKNHTDPYYAFINGIEVVSMPPYLYHTKPEDNLGLHLVGTSTFFLLANNQALETTYRFTNEGAQIDPSGDTGMLRSWEPYVGGSRDEIAGDWGDATISFTLIPNYTAPEKLYKSLRHMGSDVAATLRSNLTWELPVDSGFTYMLRLHFCELTPVINNPGERTFYIFVQDYLAENAADVLAWTKGEKGVAIYKDYAVWIQPGHKNSVNISLKMSPHQASPYPDPFLNGLEIFKISIGYNLAGPNPDPRPKHTPTPQVPFPKKSSDNTPAIVGVAASASVLLVAVVLALAVFFIKRGTNKNKGSKGSTHPSEGASTLPTKLCRHFSIQEIRAATNNLDEIFVIGAGGFGDVYKGYIDDGETQVAIKRLKPGSQQGAHEFLNEIEMLSQLRHLHLVSLIGYCYEKDEMILVYEYMTRGTLRDHLYNTDNPSLTWKQRVKLCLGAARGLHYLHTGAKHMIIHRDVKSTNILLDEKWVAKVSDFGLSRVGPIGASVTHVSTVVKGSVGYLDPEYYKRQRLTEKSDVYSFGVVMLEVLSGRQPLLRNVEKKQVSLVDWARGCYQSGTLGDIMDPTLKGDIAPECLLKFGELALSCLLDDGTHRPSMNDIVGVLEFVLQLQESSIARGVMEVEVPRNYEDSDDVFSSSPSTRHVSDNSKTSGLSMTSPGDSSYGGKETHWFMSENVFSEIGHPKGR